MKQKIFVLSMDAMVHEDVAYLETKPNFRKIMENRAEVNRVCSVYPASTYPAHTTLMTGAYPAKHGVYANFPLLANQDGISHWPLYHTSVFAEDIFSAAKRVGMTTASVYWPITGRNPNIDHCINEYFFYYNDLQEAEAVFANQGADRVALQAVRENSQLLPSQRGAKVLVPEATFDPFIMGCTCSLIRNAKPDLLMVHNCYLDSTRHRYGTFCKEIQTALDLTDQWLGDVIQAMEDAGVYRQTNFIILSDHGQIDCSKFVKTNALLAAQGLLEIAPNGNLYNWQAYAQSNGISATVYLRDNTNKKLYDRVYAVLQKLCSDSSNGIQKVYTKEELLSRYGQAGPYSFMLEAAPGIQFSDKLTAPTFVDKAPSGVHGHAPEKGPQPVFLAQGPAFRENAVLETAKLVDIAPTLAAVMGQTLPEADGTALTALLK